MIRKLLRNIIQEEIQEYFRIESEKERELEERKRTYQECVDERQKELDTITVKETNGFITVMQWGDFEGLYKENTVTFDKNMFSSIEAGKVSYYDAYRFIKLKDGLRIIVTKTDAHEILRLLGVIQ